VTPSPPVTLWLSCHVDYACRHSGACCRSGWPLPVDADAVSAIDQAVVRGRVWTVDGRINWLDEAPGGDGAAGTFRQVDGGCVFHTALRPDAAGRVHSCAVHTALGHAALPASCQHFPRVCLIDARGVRVSLSHYCPTAAQMIVDGDGPVTIVAGPPAVPGRAVPEGLDAREALPPRLTEHVLMDLEGLTAWEEHVVETLAGAPAEVTPELAVAQISADARQVAAWTPASATSLAGAVAALCPDRSTDAVAAAAERLAQASAWPAWFDLAASTCRAAWLADDPPAMLLDVDARYVVPVWPQHAAAVRRYLAAKAFGSWITYQADAAVSLTAWLTLCLAVVRIEATRACQAASRPLDRDLLVQAIRQSDLLLVHYADSLAIARSLSAATSSPGARRSS
jgi:hypothetical protein